MWFLAISIVLCFSGCFGEDTICTKQPFHVCDVPKDGLPETKLELDALCPAWKKYIDCLGEYDRTCQEDGMRKVFQTDGEFESVSDMFKDICDENSLLHAALLENLKCLKVNVPAAFYACPENMINISAVYQKPEDLEEEKEDDYYQRRGCLYELANVSCFSSEVGNSCGSVTKNVMLELADRSYILRNFCPTDVLQAISKELDTLDTEESAKQNLKEVIQRLFTK